jgi:phenylacetate-CoA ligase
LNVDWLQHLPESARRGAYFASQRLLGSRVGACWREWRRWERYSAVELDQAVEHRLSGLLSGAITQTVFYRGLGLERRPGESATDFLRRFPILGREIIRDRFTDLVIDSLRNEITSPASVSAKRYDWLVVKTGGSTGEPTTVVHDATGRDWGRATRLCSQRLCGFPLGVRYFRLWGSEQDLLQQEDQFDRRVLRNLLGEIPMNAFRARAAELTQHWKTIQAHPGIQHLMAYVDAAVSLASFIDDRGLARPRLKTIMACAGTVTPEWRQFLETTFGAEVFDKYGSRECCDLACECRQHTGLHVYSPNVYVEIIDGSGQPCALGKTGQVLVTLLNNPGFPMIRYRIGDLAAWAEPGPCPCGLAFPRLQSLQGRADEMLTTEDGTLLSSVFVRHFVGVSLNRQLIREWQLEQTGLRQFVFRYIPLQTEGLAENLARLEESFHLALGQSVAVELRQMSEIPPAPTGKVRWILSRVPRDKKSSAPQKPEPG